MNPINKLLLVPVIISCMGLVFGVFCIPRLIAWPNAPSAEKYESKLTAFLDTATAEELKSHIRKSHETIKSTEKTINSSVSAMRVGIFTMTFGSAVCLIYLLRAIQKIKKTSEPTG